MNNGQGDLLDLMADNGAKADASWFHIFRQMFDTGDVARMGPHAFTVYCAIKFHVNFATGEAFPSVERIAEMAGVSIPQVKRELKSLEEAGYLNKRRNGRSNVYTLREKVQVTDANGRPMAEATWDYLPSTVRAAQAELKNYLQTGEHGNMVFIQQLHINMIQPQFNTASGNGSINAVLGNIADPELRKQVEGMLKRQGKVSE